MTQQLSRMELEALTEALASDDLEFSVRENYSGRGMYGQTCLAIVTDDATRLLMSIGGYASENEDTRFDQARLDAMGTWAVVYWPSLKVAPRRRGGA